VAAVQLELGSRTTLVPGGPCLGSSGDAAQVSVPGLSFDQVQWLLSLIDGLGIGYEKLSGNVSWMLNSGASSRMVGDATSLEKVEQIPPVARITVEKCSTRVKIKLQPCLYIKIM